MSISGTRLRDSDIWIEDPPSPYPGKRNLTKAFLRGVFAYCWATAVSRTHEYAVHVSEHYYQRVGQQAAFIQGWDAAAKIHAAKKGGTV